MITAIIQARMSSTRLPGKVLLPLGDTTVLGHTVRQVKKAGTVEKVVVATSVESSDDPVAHFCDERGIDVYRGSLTDVLDRYYRAAVHFRADTLARITADCPLIDPLIIDRVADEYAIGRCDYVSTGRLASTFPDGMDTEVFSFAALERAWREALAPSEREHVTSYIWNHPDQFRIAEVKNETDLSGVRLTLDDSRDYELIKQVVADVPEVRMESIVAYLAAHPEVAALNAGAVRNDGYWKSLRHDAQ